MTTGDCFRYQLIDAERRRLFVRRSILSFGGMNVCSCPERAWKAPTQRISPNFIVQFPFTSLSKVTILLAFWLSFAFSSFILFLPPRSQEFRFNFNNWVAGQFGRDQFLHADWRTMAKKQPKAAYVVYHERQPGIYRNWPDCNAQVHKIPGNKHEGFYTFEAAEKA